MRDRSLDILKGISIFAIMLLHYEQGIFSPGLNKWIGGFMVSAFYLTAGWVLSLKPLPDIPTAFRKLWRSLGIPYITFSMLICAFTALMCLFGWMQWEILARDIWKFFTLRGIGTLWFLPALFFGEILFLCFNKWKMAGKLILFFLVCIYFNEYETWFTLYREQSVMNKMIDAPLNALYKICEAGLFITVNYYFVRWFRAELEEKKQGQLLLLGVIVLLFYTALLSGMIPITPGSSAGFWGPWGILFLIRGSMALPVYRFFEFFGKNSLIVMALHFSIMQQICIIINRHYTGAEELSGVSALIYFAVSVVILIPVIFFFQKYMPFMSGKKVNVQNSVKHNGVSGS